MSEVNLGSSVGQWVVEYPQTADVFETLQISYCCEGDQSVEEACWKNGLWRAPRGEFESSRDARSVAPI
ncbi:DUF542 domain-containing protein [Allorhodopirellula heiligendammensis]|uniref:DUF542 domain-containing protein n=1 Tax=Allorhodopirellula heiligendammensis TaxID=2714739 RepID=UPI0011B771F7|nr:DUF542 domain-containing protein [Allorhodopirellula heiligendammensis]